MNIEIKEESLLDDDIVKEEYTVQNEDTTVAEIEIESPSQDYQETVQFVIKVVKEKRHKCKFCDKAFHVPSALADHMVNHTTERNFHCPQCLKSFGNEHRLKVHMRCHIDKALPCHICKKTFKNTRSLNLHLHRHTGQRNHKCSICELTFKDSSQRNRHILRHVKKDSKETESSADEEAECPDCQMKFRIKNLLKDHLTVHRVEEEGICDVCSTAFRQKSNLKKHLLAVHVDHSEEKPWVCIYCYNKFTIRANLRKHLFVKHRGLPIKISDGPVECKFCKDLFLYFDDFQQHALVHSNELRFECANCEKKFNTRQKILQHVKINHKKYARKKKLTCPECGKVCKNQYNFDGHVVVHTEERPFECNICRKKFKTHQYLVIHERNHIKTPGLVCKICGRLFKKKFNLKRHEKSHKIKEK